MNKNLTDNEIKKALEQCETQKSCSDCPYFEKIGCKKHLYQNALDLINRLQAENKEWKTLVEVGELQYRKQKAEVEDLEKKLKKQIQSKRLVRKQAKAEAYKEFAERLKEKIIAEYNEYDEQEYPRARIEDIDNLLKELVGVDNG